MAPQIITLELPEDLYRSVTKLAQATKRPLDEILRESLSHTLPPLDDMSGEEAHELAQMSPLDDAALWQASQVAMTDQERDALRDLLGDQSAGELTPTGAARLQVLLDVYGRALVRQAHAWLLLARRGDNVPVQQSQG